MSQPGAITISSPVLHIRTGRSFLTESLQPPEPPMDIDVEAAVGMAMLVEEACVARLAAEVVIVDISISA